MAYKDSDQIANDSNYALGDYSFRIERSSVPGSTNDKIEAICTDKDGKNARKSIQVPSSTLLDGWYVEANETEATVYAAVQVPTGGGKESDLDTGLKQPITVGAHCEYHDTFYGHDRVFSYDFPSATWIVGSADVETVVIGEDPTDKVVSYIDFNSYTGGTTTHYATTSRSYTYQNKTVYYMEARIGFTRQDEYTTGMNPVVGTTDGGKIAWTLKYGTPSGGDYELKQMLVARFVIDLEDAGGVGPGSDWIDPGDYDPDWEPDDPTHTLYVTVTGALSGRHNDPIVDPSYSYIPADKDTVKDYGCGGDGGHGGGGGAGASTVVVHKFATNQANSKEVTAIARRHGYGSGGGKGGKGGDGCILVYY